jgi:hypothetical protein
MSDAKDPTPSEPCAEPHPGGDRLHRTCTLCGRQFLPRKNNQLYCRPKHRRQAWRMRQRALERGQPLGRPDVSPHALKRVLQADRRKGGLAALRPHPYLAARLAVLEAQARLEHWTVELERREVALSQLAPPPLRVTFQRLQAGEQPVLAADAEYCEIAGSEPPILWLAVGYRRRG